MASLSKYTLRIGITFALIITITAVISTSIILNRAQQNNVDTRLLREKYITQDNLILDKLSEVSRQLDELINTELELTLRTVLTNDLAEPSTNQINGIYSNISYINELLTDRQTKNYDFSGSIDQITLITLNLKEPETTSVIQVKNGISDIFTRFGENTNSIIKTITQVGDTLRSDLVDQRNLLQDSNNKINQNVTSYQTQYDIFETAMDNNGSNSAAAIVDATKFIGLNITNVDNEYKQVLDTLASDPLATSTSLLGDYIENAESSFDLINTTVNSIGLTSTDHATFDKVLFAAFNVTASYQVNIANVLEYIKNYQDIFDYLNENSNILRNSFVDRVTTTESLLRDETNKFRQMTSDFLNDLQSRLSLGIFIVFGGLLVVLGLIFMWIFWVFSRNLGRILDKNLKLASGDLTVRAANKYGKNEIGIIEESVDTFAIQMRTIISSMKNSSETLAGISEELAAGAEEASASITEVSSTVRDFSSGSAEQNIMLNRVREELIDHLTVVEQTANSIDETAKFVLRVAKRTNILGLNASIEAAKAGRFGLGFNVVAEEVRALSDETRDSAHQIANSIEAIEFNIRQTVQDILDEVNIIREVAENTATGSEDASIATREQVTMMTEVSQTSSQLSEISHSLNQMMQNFKV